LEPRELEGRDDGRTTAIIDNPSVRIGAQAHEGVGLDAGKRTMLESATS
jgi:hypothetical protein